MTVNEAKKILGREAKNLSDDEVRSDIETAILFKDLLFNNLTKGRNRLVRNS